MDDVLFGTARLASRGTGTINNSSIREALGALRDFLLLLAHHLLRCCFQCHVRGPAEALGLLVLELPQLAGHCLRRIVARRTHHRHQRGLDPTPGVGVPRLLDEKRLRRGVPGRQQVEPSG